MHKLLKEFKSELYPKIIPMGTALGIPLVFQNAESLFAIIPLIRKLSTNKDKILIDSPVGELVFNLLENRLVSFRLFSFNNPFIPPLETSVFATFPPKIVYERGLTRNDYDELRNILLNLIEELIELYDNKGEFEPKYIEYRKVFSDLLEDGMDKFYITRCPGYFPVESAFSTGQYTSSLDDWWSKTKL